MEGTTKNNFYMENHRRKVKYTGCLISNRTWAFVHNFNKNEDIWTKMLIDQTYFVWNLVTSWNILEMRNKLVIFDRKIKTTGYLTANRTWVFVHNFNKSEDIWIKMLIDQFYFVGNLIICWKGVVNWSYLISTTFRNMEHLVSTLFGCSWSLHLPLVVIFLDFSQNKLS